MTVMSQHKRDSKNNNALKWNSKTLKPVLSHSLPIQSLQVSILVSHDTELISTLEAAITMN